MRRLFFVLCSLLFAHCSFAQFAQQRQAANRPQSLYSLIQETNRLMEHYSSFRPDGRVVFHSIKQLEFTPDEVQHIQTDSYLANFLSREKDSIAVFAAIELFQEKIGNSFRRIVSHQEFARRTDKQQMLSGLRDIKVTISDDSRLYNFTFDSKHSGIYQMRTSKMHYIRPIVTQNVTGITSLSSTNNTRFEQISPRAYQVFAKDGYSEIFLLDRAQSIYLLIGLAQISLNNYECYADLVVFEDGVFKKYFDSRVRTSNPANCIVFDKTNNTLRVRESTYVFDGATFVRSGNVPN